MTMDFWKNAAVAVPLKYLSKFWRLLEMPLINCNVEWKFIWTKHCVLAVAVNDNTDADPDNIIFVTSDSNVCVFAVTLSAKDNQKLSKLFSHGFERLVYWRECKTRYENKNAAKKYRYFLESNLRVNRFFVFIFIQVKMAIQKAVRLKDIICQKVLLGVVTSSSTEKLLWATHWFWYKTIWKDKKVNNKPWWRYAEGLWMDYEYIKN